MVSPFSRTNNIGGLPAAVVNYILSFAWVADVLRSFGLDGRLRLTRLDEVYQPGWALDALGLQLPFGIAAGI